MSRFALADSGFWFGLLNDNDSYHTRSLEVYKDLEQRGVKILKPWPSMYEVWSTKMVKRLDRLNTKHLLSACGTEHLIDHDLILTELSAQIASYQSGQPLQHSLVDSAINLILKKSNLRISYLITNNRVDFEKTRSLLKNKFEIIDLKSTA